jgi:hypothetical protein
MASRSLGTLTIDLIAKTGGFVQGMTAAERESAKASDKIKKQWKEAGQAIDAGIKIGVAAVAGAVAGLGALVAKTSAAIDEQAKFAQRLDTTYASVSTLQRAGELAGVSMDQISNASRALSVNLGKAADASSAQAKTLDRLGLSAAELAAIPLDQRIAAINTAISQNVPAFEQAAVAADLFGAKNGAAIASLDNDTLRTAAEQAQVFGTALSDVDAAKVEMANDAISTLKVAFDGFAQQITVKFAPIIKALGDLFFDTAKEAGGFGNVADSVFNGLIKAVGFTLNAFDGLKRAVSVVLDGIVAGIAKVVQFITTRIAAGLDLISKLPGVDFSETVADLNAFASTAGAIYETAGKRIDEAITAPLAGERFKEFVKNAEAAGTAAAEAAVAARNAVTGEGGEGGTSGSSGVDDKALEKLKENTAKRLAVLQESFFTETQLLGAKFVEEQRLLTESLELGLVTREEYNNLELESRQRYEDAITAIDDKAAMERMELADKERKAKEQVYKSMFGNLSTLMNSHSKKMFAVGKAAALAQAIIDGYAAITGAYKHGSIIGGPLLGAAYAATAAAATAVQIQAIRSQSFGGGGGAPSAGVSATAAVNAATEQIVPVSQRQQVVDIRLEGSSRLTLAEVADAMEQMGERLADSGGRMGKVTVLTA